ncbi:phytoene/squalene synthase family protein [Roseospirillum parvum]|uniref:Phytoene synthase n=1 Tax=Roseospirillum parvum TaxID=83401 RepID=A0A1G8AY43_9PROT|nr:phytoene/squalene synthase family protein [Roseospirillum parvum]SDH25764.1 phytoene synthase [Roseospirillum parvum]
MGATWLKPDFGRRRDKAACREMIRGGSRSFFFASLLLPPPLRDPAYAIYAFCRLSDDTVDDCEVTGLAPVESLYERLDLAYAGRPLDTPADRAFAETVDLYGIPRALPAALLEGMAWDCQDKRYETLEDLHDYAARVAGTVGAMMSLLLGARDPVVVARACDLGVAMQLTNICRDVGEDARRGRIYLPRAWMRGVGLDPECWLADPKPGPALASIVKRLLAEADRLYDRAATGIAGLPSGCRPAIHAARLFYREIGYDVLRAGGDSVTRRAVVPGDRKAALVASALAAAARRTEVDPSPPLVCNRFLVDAARNAPEPKLEPGPLGRAMRRIDNRVGWTVELFLELEQRERAAQMAAAARG